MQETNYFTIKKMSPQLLVADLKRAIEFYTKQLGFELDFLYGDFYAGISKDGCSIHLKLGMRSIEEMENRKRNEHLDILFSIENIEDVYGAMQHTSAKIIQPFRNMPYGKEFYIGDPDGHIIAFVSTAV